MPRVLLLSAYHADSHAAWVDWLLNHIEGVEWIVRKLPGRHFAWRIRGNPLNWLDKLPDEPPDLILATSMVDLATLKGLHPQLAGVPAWYYFHENQFAYPVSKQQIRSIEPCIVQLYGALAADRLIFNSEFNRRSFLAGIEPFLAQMPDLVPADLPERLAARSDVLPVPVEPIPAGRQRDWKLIVWNHRWEYDKRPELFAEAVCRLADSGVAFRLALLGKRARKPPPALRRIREQLSDRIVADGRVDRARYVELLGCAAIVVSTAAHEFQGISMLEAASAGARPLVPDALCYPEQFSPAYRYRAGDSGALACRLEAWLGGALPPPAAIDEWLAPAVRRRWQTLLGSALREQVDVGHIDQVGRLYS